MQALRIGKMSLWCMQALRRVITRIHVLHDGRYSPELLDYCVLTLELVYREFLVKNYSSGLADFEEEASQCVLTALRKLSHMKEITENSLSDYHPPMMCLRTVGRPRFVISRQQLDFLVENNFTVPQMSLILGVSSRTIERRLSENGIYIRARYADLIDAELHRIVSEIQEEYPSCGNQQMRGHLLSRGYRIQQHRIREAQRTVDPECCIMRQLHVINRRTYNVPSPRSLWHVDSNHKLIR